AISPQANVQVPVKYVFRPPQYQVVVGCTAMTEGKIDLRHDVVDPAFFQPLAAVCKLIIVGSAPVGIGPPEILIQVFPDAEGADPEFATWFFAVDAVLELADKQVHVFAAPVIQTHSPWRMPAKKRGVRNVFAPDRIGVKVVVEVDAVYIVVPDYVHDHLYNVFAGLGDPGIKQLFAAVIEEPFGMAPGNMVRGNPSVCLEYRPVRIKPRMEFHASFVGLVKHELKRIVKGIGGFPLHALKPFGLGLPAIGVQGISCWSDLDKQGVDPAFAVPVELPGEFQLLRTGR